MKTLLIVCLGLTAALAGPPPAPAAAQNPVLAKEDQRPLPGGGADQSVPEGQQRENPLSVQRSEVEPGAPLEAGPEVKDREPGSEPEVSGESKELEADSKQVKVGAEGAPGVQEVGGHNDMEPLDEGRSLDGVAQQSQTSEEHLPRVEAAGLQEKSDDRRAEGEEGSDGRSGVEAGEEGAEQVQSQLPKASRRSFCTGVLLQGKCYVFFKNAKKASDAEFFCQHQFYGGHLASITSYDIHRSVMNMMLQQNGAYTRTWIGGLRYLDTGRFVWLDGSSWGYADWLPGEPNHTVGKEHCVELLPYGRGKFNDFTCWEPQAFICSHPY